VTQPPPIPKAGYEHPAAVGAWFGDLFDASLASAVRTSV
jgi:hypothetical protein